MNTFLLMLISDELEYNYGEKENRENNLNLQNSTLERDIGDENEECSVLRTPLRSLKGHRGGVIAADWLPGGEQVVTAGWDRLACIWDTQTGQLLHEVIRLNFYSTNGWEIMENYIFEIWSNYITYL
jgi:WD40 repeat protein